MNWRFRHRDVVVVVVIVLRGLWSTVHGSGRHKRLVLIIVVMLRRLWWSSRSGALVTIVTISLLWLSAVVQSLCRVMRELVGIVRLGRLGNVLALEAKVKIIDVVLYRGSLA